MDDTPRNEKPPHEKAALLFTGAPPCPRIILCGSCCRSNDFSDTPETAPPPRFAYLFPIPPYLEYAGQGRFDAFERSLAATVLSLMLTAMFKKQSQTIKPIQAV